VPSFVPSVELGMARQMALGYLTLHVHEVISIVHVDSEVHRFLSNGLRRRRDRPTISLSRGCRSGDSKMLWARMLAYVTGTANQELEYLAAENRILRDQINGRLLPSEGEKVTLAEIAHRLGRSGGRGGNRQA
jgi:hypothetical protein